MFEARNYLSIWVALVVAAAAELGPGSLWGKVLSAPGGAGRHLAFKRPMKGQKVGDIAGVELAEINLTRPCSGRRDSNDERGLETARAVYRERGLAAKIIPSGPNAKVTWPIWDRCRPSPMTSPR